VAAALMRLLRRSSAWLLVALRGLDSGMSAAAATGLQLRARKRLFKWQLRGLALSQDHSGGYGMPEFVRQSLRAGLLQELDRKPVCRVPSGDGPREMIVLFRAQFFSIERRRQMNCKSNGMTVLVDKCLSA